MKSKLKRVMIIGMVGLMVLGGGVSAFADEVEVEMTERPEKAMMRNGGDRLRLRDKVSDLSEDIQEQLEELREARTENGELAREILGLEGGNFKGLMKGGRNAEGFAEKFAGKFEEKMDKLRETHPDQAERLEERQAAKAERQARIDELKEEYPDEFQSLEENREEMKELRMELRDAINEGNEDAIGDIIDEMMEIIEENKGILESVSASEE